jgi:hypothetical protein
VARGYRLARGEVLVPQLALVYGSHCSDFRTFLFGDLAVSHGVRRVGLVLWIENHLHKLAHRILHELTRFGIWHPALFCQIVDLAQDARSQPDSFALESVLVQK